MLGVIIFGISVVIFILLIAYLTAYTAEWFAARGLVSGRFPIVTSHGGMNRIHIIGRYLIIPTCNLPVVTRGVLLFWILWVDCL